MKLTVEFAGGLEYLFGGKQSLFLDVPEATTIKDLISILVEQHLQERKELFILDDSVYGTMHIFIH